MNGDSLRSLATRFYGSEDYWYIIGDANGSEYADSFQPQNLGQIVGDTTPTLPYVPAPAQAGCNVVATLIVIAIVVAVSVISAGAMSGAAASAAGGSTAAGTAGATAGAVTGGAAAGTAGAGIGATMTAGSAVMTGSAMASYGISATAMIGSAAFGGAMGSLAGQAVGMALGVQDKFSFKDVLTSAGTSAVGSGLGKYLSETGKVAGMSTLNDAKNGMSPWGAALNVGGKALAGAGLNKLVGKPSGFSWRNLAASMGTAAIGTALGLGDPINDTQRFDEANLAWDTFSGIANAGINHGLRKAFGDKGAHWNFRDVAVDSFGNALANSIVGEIKARAKSEDTGVIDAATGVTSGSSPGMSAVGKFIDMTDPKATKGGIGSRGKNGLGRKSEEQEAKNLSDVVVVGKKEGVSDKSDEPTIYVVKSGDTLGEISEKFYGDAYLFTLIAQANGITDPNYSIQAGQKLVLPGEKPVTGEYKATLSRQGHAEIGRLGNEAKREIGTSDYSRLLNDDWTLNSYELNRLYALHRRAGLDMNLLLSDNPSYTIGGVEFRNHTVTLNGEEVLSLPEIRERDISYRVGLRFLGPSDLPGIVQGTLGIKDIDLAYGSNSLSRTFSEGWSSYGFSKFRNGQYVVYEGFKMPSGTLMGVPVKSEMSAFQYATKYQLGAAVKWSAALAPLGTTLDYMLQPDKHFGDNNGADFTADVTVDTFKGVVAGGAAVYTTTALEVAAYAAVGITLGPLTLLAAGIALGVAFSYAIEETIVEPSGIRDTMKKAFSSPMKMPENLPDNWWQRIP